MNKINCSNANCTYEHSLPEKIFSKSVGKVIACPLCNADILIGAIEGNLIEAYLPTAKAIQCPACSEILLEGSLECKFCNFPVQQSGQGEKREHPKLIAVELPAPSRSLTYYLLWFLFSLLAIGAGVFLLKSG